MRDRTLLAISRGRRGKEHLLTRRLWEKEATIRKERRKRLQDWTKDRPLERVNRGGRNSPQGTLYLHEREGGAQSQDTRKRKGNMTRVVARPRQGKATRGGRGGRKYEPGQKAEVEKKKEGGELKGLVGQG